MRAVMFMRLVPGLALIVVELRENSLKRLRLKRLRLKRP